MCHVTHHSNVSVFITALISHWVDLSFSVVWIGFSISPHKSNFYDQLALTCTGPHSQLDTQTGGVTSELFIKYYFQLIMKKRGSLCLLTHQPSHPPPTWTPNWFLAVCSIVYLDLITPGIKASIKKQSCNDLVWNASHVPQMASLRKVSSSVLAHGAALFIYFFLLKS